MTRPDSRYPDPEPGCRSEPDGVVESFFTAHREQIPEVTPDELTWRRIRDEHRRRGRTARRTSVAGMAVAAAAVAVGAYAVWPYLNPELDPTAQQGGQPVATESEEPGADAGTLREDTTEATTEATSTPEDDAGTTASPGPDGLVDPGELPPPVAAGEVDPSVPDDLVLTAVSQDQQGGMTAVGSSESDSAGTLLLRAPDATGPWEAVADLDPLAEGTDGSVTSVEFADADTGYAWSEQELHLTTDGGSTWQHLPLGGTHDLHDVLVRGGTVHVAVTATGCGDASCGGLLTGPVAEHGLLLAPLGAEDTELVQDPVLRAAGDEVYLHVPATGSWRWQDGRAERLALPMECGGPPRALAGAPEQAGFVATACPGQGETPLLVAASDIGGRTWGPASPEVMEPLRQDDGGSGGGDAEAGAAPVQLAVADPSRMAVISDGQVSTSTDGGRTWQPASEPLPLDAADIAQLETLRDGTLVALAPEAGEPGGYWASDDGGQTWQRVDLGP